MESGSPKLLPPRCPPPWCVRWWDPGRVTAGCRLGAERGRVAPRAQLGWSKAGPPGRPCELLQQDLAGSDLCPVPVHEPWQVASEGRGEALHKSPHRSGEACEGSALALPGRSMREGPVPQHFRVLPQPHPPICQPAVCSSVTT